jgi:large subunit ribosomal protein L19e
MNIKNKKELAARTLGVGIHRIKFNTEGISEIKEAITKQDMISLSQEGIILIKPIKGRKKVKKRNTRRGPGKIKMKIKNRKKNYVRITRKLRKYIIPLKNQKKMTKELYIDLRKKIKSKSFKSIAGLKDYISNLEALNKKLGEKNETKKKDKAEKAVKKQTRTRK